MNFFQTFLIAVQSIKTNKLRTGLTVLGIVVGIFSIIVIMTVVTMLQNSIESGVSQLNQNTFQIQKMPAMQTGGPGSRDRFRNRKDITLEEFSRLKEMLTSAKYIGAEQWQWGVVVKFGNRETNPNIMFAGVTTEAMKTNNWIIESGREIRESDVVSGNSVCLLGKEVADKLFPNIDPVGKTVRVGGKPLTVIGVLEKQPQMFGQSRDSYVVAPISLWQSMYGRRSRSVNITVMAHSKETYNETIEAAIGYMRNIRKVPPGEENDFDIYSNESLIGQINDMTVGVKVGALVVSIIALLAAGVGIMNIMLVSVTERTKEIGIRKALGAKRKNILLQFLSEAVFLCIIGGIIGIFIGVIIGNFAGSLINAQSAIPYDWIFIGITLCIMVGVGFGTYPAYKAANLDPIEALRYE
jgi:putative ABC transport system permease protein